MKLELIRTYFPHGTNGEILFNGKHLVYSIELPWKNNSHGVSCIPEGFYELKKRYSPRYKWHLELLNVPHRQLILVHAANDAVKELKGCIAPVSVLSGEGMGMWSRNAVEKINHLVFATLLKKEQVFLIIKSNKQ